MFKFIKSLFKKCFSRKEKVIVKAPKKDDAANKKVNFNTRLIKNLVVDHQILLADFTQMMTAASENDYAVANQMLGVFTKKLIAHLNIEDIELYTFLEYMAKMTPEDKASMAGFKSEMSGIAIVVTDLVNKYTNKVVSESNVESFISDFGGVAPVLIDRIDREEKKLYPMYGKYKV